jgi:hypothetical protein
MIHSTSPSLLGPLETCALCAGSGACPRCKGTGLFPDTRQVAEAAYAAVYGETPHLTNADRLEVFLAGDGFGRMDRAAWEASGIGWDWSHVRDSSLEGWERVAYQLLAKGAMRLGRL